jgi:hypothetical protein
MSSHWTRYFMSGKMMRHAKWQESVMNSIKKREKINGYIDHYVCGCGCGTVATIKPFSKETK